MRHLILTATLSASLLGLGACQSDRIDPTGVAANRLPPIASDYKTRILAWARGFYAEPHGLRATRIADPLMVRDESGRLVWLVCIEADSRRQGGDYMGTRREAFGFAPNYMSSPLERNGATLVREDCDAHPLVWHEWPELRRL